MREICIQDKIRALGTGDLRLFRNNNGVALTVDGRRIVFGLHPGSPDLIGWKSIVITPDMIGQRIAVAVGLEVKSERGRPTREQERFIRHMIDFGAYAGIARSVEDAKIILHLSS